MSGGGGQTNTYWQRLLATLVVGGGAAIPMSVSQANQVGPVAQANNRVLVAAGTVVTVTGNSPDITVPNAAYKGLFFVVNVTAVSGTTPSLTVSLQFKEEVSGLYVTPPTGAIAGVAITLVGSQAFLIYPGIAVVANASFSSYLSNTFRFAYTVSGTTPSFTFGIGGNFIL